MSPQIILMEIDNLLQQVEHENTQMQRTLRPDAYDIRTAFMRSQVRVAMARRLVQMASEQLSRDKMVLMHLKHQVRLLSRSLSDAPPNCQSPDVEPH